MRNIIDPSSLEADELFMREAIAEAILARDMDEVPVGAVCVKDGKIISRAHNTRETTRCATHHAEVLAIERACAVLGGWRLPGVTLYVTMEPCVMCGGAVVNSRIERVVFGAHDLRFGAFGSALDINSADLNHKPAVEGGVLAEECRALLSDYFKAKRERKAEK